MTCDERVVVHPVGRDFPPGNDVSVTGSTRAKRGHACFHATERARARERERERATAGAREIERQRERESESERERERERARRRERARASERAMYRLPGGVTNLGNQVMHHQLTD